MSSSLSVFNWRGQPSEIGKSLAKTTGTAAPAKGHPLRGAEAQKVRSTSRAPTASINTEPVRTQRTKQAAI
jgi:hypothetical protein